MKRQLLVAALPGLLFLTACKPGEPVVNREDVPTSLYLQPVKQASTEEVVELPELRRITVYNGAADKNVMVIEGWLAFEIDSLGRKVEITTYEGDLRKVRTHTVVLGDELTFFCEDIREPRASEKHYKALVSPGVDEEETTGSGEPRNEDVAAN